MPFHYRPLKRLPLALTPSTGAQHRYQRSLVHHIKARPITCRSRDPDASTPSFPSHYAFPLYRSATTYAYLLWLYLAHTSDHHSHRSLHNRPPFAIEYLSLHPSYLLLVSLPPTSSHFSISLPLFADI